MNPRRLVPLLVLFVLFVLTALPASAELGLRGWGPRVGLAADPDQVLFGFHFDVGDVATKLRMVPNVQLGIGDDVTVLEGTLPLHYVFGKTGAGFAPYAGGGLAVAWFDVDREGDGPGNGNGNDDFDDSDVELGVKAIGGLEWSLGGRKKFFVELSLGIGDLHDFQAVAGWTF